MPNPERQLRDTITSNVAGFMAAEGHRTTTRATVVNPSHPGTSPTLALGPAQDYGALHPLPHEGVEARGLHTSTGWSDAEWYTKLCQMVNEKPDVLPLPWLGRPTKPMSRSTRCRTRHCRRLTLWRMTNEIVYSINWAHQQGRGSSAVKRVEKLHC